MTLPPTPGDRLRVWCRERGLPQADLDYLLGVLGEAVLVERGRLQRKLGNRMPERTWHEARECIPGCEFCGPGAGPNEG